MDQESYAELARRVAILERERTLVLALDAIRDEHETSIARLLSATAQLLVEQFEAVLVAIYLIDRETNALTAQATQATIGLRTPIATTVLDALAALTLEQDHVTLWALAEAAQAAQVTVDVDGYFLAGMPVIFGNDQHLGAVLLIRPAPYNDVDQAVLTTTESIIDSAIQQGYVHYDLHQRHKELETIYHIDHIRDLRLPFDQMLTKVVDELRAVIAADIGFILLYHHLQDDLELRTATDLPAMQQPARLVLARDTAREALSTGDILVRNDLNDFNAQAILCMPLILENEIIGVLGVLNLSGRDNFGRDDQRLMNAIGRQIDTAIFENMEQRRLRAVLGRSVDPQIMRRLLDTPDVDFLRGERMFLSVLYADIRGSTALAERTQPDVLVDFINDYLSRMGETVLEHGGTLDKFVGDEVMALFGAPFPQEDHALRAIQVGLAMQQVHQLTIADWRARGLEAPLIGVGIATGELTAGEFGYHQRTDYTVIGPAANLGARLCSAARGGEVLICATTYEKVRDNVVAHPVTGLALKGIDDRYTAYQVVKVLAT